MSSPGPVTPLQVGLQLHRAYALATQELNIALRPMDLTVRHVATMFLIRDGIRTHRDLVHRLHTDKTGMVRVLDDLEDLGIVSRSRSARDRRSWLLDLTEDGTATLERAQEHTQTVAEKLFGPLDQDELTAVYDGLAHVLGEFPKEQ